MSNIVRLPPKKQSISDLIDALGDIKAKIAPLCDEERRIKDELIIRLGNNAVSHGTKFDVTISTAIQHRLDTDKARGFLTPKELQKATNEIEVTTVKCVARVRDRKPRSR